MALKILKNEPLKKYTNYKIGGISERFIIVEKEEEVAEAINLAKKGGKFFILGAGTNVLFGDDPYDGTIIKINLKTIKKTGNEILVEAGVLMADLLNFCAEKGLSGLEWAGGLPGTVGGAICGNAGAFGGEMKDPVLTVRSVGWSSDIMAFTSRNRKDCLFGYRESIFKRNNEIILNVVLSLKKRDRKEIENEINSRILYRKEHQPLEYPSAGSTFKNIPLDTVSAEVRKEFATVVKTDPFPVIPAAAVLDKLSLKGARIGGAEISPKHPNFFINKNNACYDDVVGLINLSKEKAKEKYGIKLEEELKIIA